MVHYRGYRRVLGTKRSEWLFRLLQSDTGGFRREFLAGMLGSVRDRQEPVHGRVYLNIGHTGLDQDGLGEWVRMRRVRPVYFVHDLIPLSHPQFCRAGEPEKHRRRMLTILDTACGVIGNSQATLDELAAFAEQEGRKMPPAIVGWLGTEVRHDLGSKPADEPLFVALGTIEARKNHMLLLDIWSQLASAGTTPVPRLVLIGQRGWECADVFDRLEKDDRLRENVVELNDCPDRELFGFVAAARALLFPSFTEGFGMPLTEALAAGTPVIASDLPVFREIGQGVPDLVDASDAGAWERAVLAYAEPESPQRRAQLHRMKNFKPYSWHDHFAAIGPWLEKL